MTTSLAISDQIRYYKSKTLTSHSYPIIRSNQNFVTTTYPLATAPKFEHPKTKKKQKLFGFGFGFHRVQHGINIGDYNGAFFPKLPNHTAVLLLHVHHCHILAEYAF
jgi:hypothetical protein